MRKKPEYRALTELDLSDGERRAAYGKRDAVTAARVGQDRLIAAARAGRPDFEDKARWFVVTCRAGLEDKVVDSLREAGIACWCPRERMKRRPRRGLPAVEIFLPAFRGYLFVRVVPGEMAYAGLLRAASINGFMGRDGQPYPMDDKLVAIMMRRWKKHERNQADPDDLDHLRSAIGKPAVARSGPFSSFAVTVRRLLEDEREFAVEVTMLGRMVEVTIPVDSVEF